MFENIKSAFVSVWANKVRSALTVLGVIIGVSSVTTLVALGQGLQNDVSKLIEGLGTNILVVLSGKVDTTLGSAGATNPANFVSGDILTIGDYEAIAALPGVASATPITLVPGSFKFGDKVAGPVTIGAYPNILDTMDILKLAKGKMFATKDVQHVVVLGPNAASDLFDTRDPIGQKVLLDKTELEVIGTLAKGKTTGVFGSEVDNFAIIPFGTATELNKNQVKIHRISIKTADTAKVSELKTMIKNLLLNRHGTEDFSVLTQDDLLGLFKQFLNLATALVSAIAAISLLVGGIGIMNIMLVVVTERTREIGLRKAVGATREAILVQFLTEAIVVTLVGGLLGLGVSFGASLIVAAKTALKPAITPGVIGLALGISSIVGLIFGLWPALRAASKDPVEALRYE